MNKLPLHVLYVKKIVENENFCRLTEKECNGINKASHEGHSNIHATLGDFVHVECHKVFTVMSISVLNK